MSAFLKAVAASTIDWTLYRVLDWRKIGAAEAFMAQLADAFHAGTFADVVVPFDCTDAGQAQYLSAATSLRRLVYGYVKNARSDDPAKPREEIEARYPMFVLNPLTDDSRRDVTITVKDAKGKESTKVVSRLNRTGILIKLSAAILAEQAEQN